MTRHGAGRRRRNDATERSRTSSALSAVTTRQTAAVLPAPGRSARRLRRRRGTRGRSADTDGAAAALLRLPAPCWTTAAPAGRAIRRAGAAARRGRRCGRRGLFSAEPLLGFLLGFALGVFVATAALVFLALARFAAAIALDLAGGIALAAAARFFLGNLALFGLADFRIARAHGRARCARLRSASAARRRRTSTEAQAARILRLAQAPAVARALHDAPSRAPLGAASTGFRIPGAANTALHFLDHNRLGAAMAEALAHHALLDAAARA